MAAGEGPPAAQYDALVVDGVLAFAFPGFGVDENDVASDDEDMICVWLILITGSSAGGRVLWCVFDVHGVDEYCRRVPGHPLSDYLGGLLLAQDTSLDRTGLEVMAGLSIWWVRDAPATPKCLRPSWSAWWMAWCLSSRVPVTLLLGAVISTSVVMVVWWRSHELPEVLLPDHAPELIVRLYASLHYVVDDVGVDDVQVSWS